MGKCCRAMCKLAIIGFLVAGGAGCSIGAQSAPQSQATSSLVAAMPPAIDIGDGGLLSNEPCGPPCFFDIKAGESSREDALLALQRRNMISACEVTDGYDEISDRRFGGWVCPGFSLTFPEATGVIDTIRFEPTTPVALVDIVEKLGFPDAVTVLDTGLPESPSTRASIYYTDLRIVLPLGGEQEGVVYEIRPTTEIDVVNYLDTQSYQESLEIFRGYLYTWNGYGGYP